ncbi:MAG TPA: hypothetical protein VMT75_07210 [Candidatus Saccharimonadales bacterium]|nr:hypothetical protein [Candidatus Saccharimonadales bacterium]
MPNENWVFWLNITNVVLGVVVILAALAVGYGLVWEFVLRHKKAHHAAANVDVEFQKMLQDEFAHGMPHPELGFTMADGGDVLNPPPQGPKDKEKK